MIVQATYKSLDEIPEKFEGSLRDEFHQVDGKWVLKDTAIPGVGVLFNKALYDNEQRAITQAKNHRDRAKALEAEVNELRSQLATVQTPGNVSLSSSDAKNWERYTKLGTPKDLEQALEELGSLRDKVQKFELEKAVSDVAKASGLNAEVLSDWAFSSEGKNLAFELKTVDNKQVAFVKVEKSDSDGKVSVEEKELLAFAKEALPEWKYTALTSEVKSQPEIKQSPKLPILGSSQSKVDNEERKRPVDLFNQQRQTKPSPFLPKAHNK